MSDRILFFGDAASVHLQRWVAAMAARGFECLVVTRSPGALLQGVPGARELHLLQPGSDAAGWLAALPAVRRLAARLRPAWLHGHYVTSYGLWAAACRGVVPAPLVQTAWGSDILVTPRARSLHGRVMRALVGWSLRRADLITADSQDMLAEIRRYLPPAASRLEEVLWGADTTRFQPGDAAPGFEIASPRNWEPNYRIDVVLAGFAAFTARCPQAAAVLHLLGGGPQAQALRAQAQALGVADRVRFTGRVDAATLAATLQRCRVAVSVPASDATSVSVLEAMACGLPVLASDLPANRQWLDASALLPASSDPAALAAALADALQRLAEAPALAAAQGQRNLARVQAQASQQAQMDRMAQLYRALRPGVAA
jgi:glycosyltransferase involved in cell wall biosynthesis